ncbi:hypothetical protein Back11_41940 [Paenibacillus baekrokdamisoli]|uniref:Uncharacterized protein n=1 Tax=Paenibacillus baekrokdamisoli TaxID=1712516 RepID=A0A3G9JIJ3_9BACL|nr:hypothetical protein [Paenibacillus baekrokdamisoli]MBB3068107.1 hypothetical protein [Paenibacillus baekrokdamisoli]BBH22849.1 hypothetical protein Back11_41940 [Paenibacillus baekrokdamisoli]
MSQLRTITFVFPNASSQEKAWNHLFGSLLQGIPACQGDHFIISSSQKNALPQTSFRSANIPLPRIVFDAAELEMNMDIGRISLSAGVDDASLGWGSMSTDQASPPLHTERTSNALPISELHDLLKDKLVGLDHSGVNIPTSCMQRGEWEEIIGKISEVCNLYRYPDEDWPFIIPADEAEFAADITAFTVKRTPKFEWVYDSYTDKPVFQFALETTMTQAEAEKQFPAPSGFAIPGLDHIFRSVIVDSPWHTDLTIRMDLYYKSEQGELSDWESGEWLIKSGGRIRG